MEMIAHEKMLNCQALTVCRCCKNPCRVKMGKIGSIAAEVHDRTASHWIPWWREIRKRHDMKA